MSEKIQKSTIKTQICEGIPSNPGCGIEKSIYCFYETPKGSGKYRKTCKDCVSAVRKLEREKYEELKKSIDSDEIDTIGIDELSRKTMEYKRRKELNNEYLLEKVRLLEEKISFLEKEVNNFKIM